MRSCPDTDIDHLKHLKSLFPCGPLKKNFRCMDHIRKLDDCTWMDHFSLSVHCKQ